MTNADLITLALMAAGTAFFAAGTAGILRFPDLYSRLHALTKADNLGLGLIVAGLMIQADSVLAAAKLLAVWVLALISSAVGCYLVASRAWDLDEPSSWAEGDARPHP